MAELSARQGATSPAHRRRDQFVVWRASHRHFAREALRRLLATPLATAATLAMLGIAIAVPTLLQVGVSNLQRWSGQSSAGLELNAYLRAGIEQEPVELGAWLATQNLVLKQQFISPEQALEELAALAGDDSARLARSLPQNPLPATLRIVLQQRGELASTADELASALRSRPEVESVSFDLEWFRKADALVNFAAQLRLATALLLGAGVVLVIGNSVRVAIESRREEIVVAKLVGATHGYARRPFLYLGAWLGAGGALLALVLSGICLLALTYYISPIEKAFGHEIGLRGLSASNALQILGGSATLGWLGAWLVAAQQLRRIEPS
ncbi:MAG: permease-like cell division protein FtsX [Pseudomonadales bacterium]